MANRLSRRIRQEAAREDSLECHTINKNLGLSFKDKTHQKTILFHSQVSEKQWYMFGEDRWCAKNPIDMLTKCVNIKKLKLCGAVKIWIIENEILGPIYWILNVFYPIFLPASSLSYSLCSSKSECVLLYDLNNYMVHRRTIDYSKKNRESSSNDKAINMCTILLLEE